MEIKNIKTALLSSYEGNEVNELLKFSFNTALTYLIDKYNDCELPADILSIEETAIKISAVFFQQNPNGDLEIADSQKELFENCSTKGDFEYELINLIHIKIDCTLNG